MSLQNYLTLVLLCAFVVCLGIGEPVLPRKRKPPTRLDDGAGATPYHPDSAFSHYRVIYYSIVDAAIQAITDRFNQVGLQVYNSLETVLLQGCIGESVPITPQLMSVYGKDINFDVMQVQLGILATKLKAEGTHFTNFADILRWFLNNNKLSELFSEVVMAVRLLLVLPATNAVSERSFSTLRRVKTYLRSVMTQERLNDLMTLHIYKEQTDKLCSETVIQQYVGDNTNRAARIAC